MESVLPHVTAVVSADCGAFAPSVAAVLTAATTAAVTASASKAKPAFVFI
jgi:hypothetical protein